MSRTRDRPSFPCLVEKGRLVPTTAYAAEEIDRYSGKVVQVWIYRSPNPKQWGVYWSVLSQLVEGGSIDAPDARTAGKMLLEVLGYVSRWRTFAGVTVIEPVSHTDFDAAGFSDYLTRALDYIAFVQVPGLDRDALSEGRIVYKEAA